MRLNKLRSYCGTILLLIFFFVGYQFAKSEIETAKVENLIGIEVFIRLVNGDTFTCEIKDIESKDNLLMALTVVTKVGRTKVFASEIAEITPLSELNRHSHRIYFLPTAEPISKNHFIGNYELLFFYAGVGITDYFSFMAGRSIIPGSPSEFQITNLNAKATVYRRFWETMPGNMSVALGINHAMLNSANKLTHLYTSLTFVTEKSVFTGSVYAKLGEKDAYNFRISNGVDFDTYPFIYEDGAFGIAIGLDTRFASMKDVHVIAELWNDHIAEPTNTGVLLGVRIGNTKVSADFGLAFFTSPFLLPFTSFVWTPF
jgi:hypothetical protein